MTWQDDFKRDYGLDETRVAAFSQLLDLLLRQSDRGLTAVTGPDKMVDFHFRDSLSLLSLPEVVGAANAVDIGSGAGFPGLPLALALPSLSVTLLEPNRSKCAFIADAIQQVGAANAVALPLRSEDAARSELRDSFDLSLARAVGPLPVTLEYCAPLVRPAGSLVLQRGALTPADRELALSVSGLLNLSLDRIVPVWPYPGARNLHVWVFRKLGPTPDRFPRKPGLAKKRPLDGS